MLVRSSSAQHQLMEPAPGAESQSPGSLQLMVNCVIRSAPAASLAESKKEKEASPQEGDRPPIPQMPKQTHSASAALAKRPDVRGNSPDILIGDGGAALGKHDPRMLLGFRHTRNDGLNDAVKGAIRVDPL